MKYDYEFLRKCDGLMFHATFHEKGESGFIKVLPEDIRLCYGEYCDNSDTFNRYRTCTFNKSTLGIIPEDFTIIPRDPDVYADFHPGDVLTFNEKYISIHFRMRGIVIGVDLYDGATIPFTCTELFGKGYRLVLTDVEKELIKKFKKNDKSKKVSLKDGDFCYLENLGGSSWMFIKRGSKCDTFAYVSMSNDMKWFNYHRVIFMCPEEGIKTLRKATEGEIKMMEAVFSRNNLKWNSTLKRLENIRQYEDGDAVLVRDCANNKWMPAVFKEYEVMSEGLFYRTYPDEVYKQCLPLNTCTKSLLFTSESLI